MMKHIIIHLAYYLLLCLGITNLSLTCWEGEVSIRNNLLFKAIKVTFSITAFNVQLWTLDEQRHFFFQMQMSNNVTVIYWCVCKLHSPLPAQTTSSSWLHFSLGPPSWANLLCQHEDTRVATWWSRPDFLFWTCAFCLNQFKSYMWKMFDAKWIIKKTEWKMTQQF